MQKNKKRIDLLPQAEINDLYKQPIFSDEERLPEISLCTRPIALNAGI